MKKAAPIANRIIPDLLFLMQRSYIEGRLLRVIPSTVYITDDLSVCNATLFICDQKVFIHFYKPQIRNKFFTNYDHFFYELETGDKIELVDKKAFEDSIKDSQFIENYDSTNVLGEIDLLVINKELIILAGFTPNVRMQRTFPTMWPKKNYNQNMESLVKIIDNVINLKGDTTIINESLPGMSGNAYIWLFYSRVIVFILFACLFVYLFLYG